MEASWICSFRVPVVAASMILLAIIAQAQELAAPPVLQSPPTLPPTVVQGNPNDAAGEPAFNEPVQVEGSAFGRGQNLLGNAESASEGSISGQDIQLQPLLRTGEILENVPGLIVTQHSGSGKANQYFLRGFNLDHGTDFSVFFEGAPINLPTHAHGQGYLDLNFVIPELVERIEFRKGPYYADVGDFSSVGTSSFHVVDRLDCGIAKLEFGENQWFRTLVADSWTLGPGDLLLAFERQTYNGPWAVPEDVDKLNGYAKYTIGDELCGASISGIAYSNGWTSTDQIPLRAVTSGQIPRLGAIDATDGGVTYRYGLNGHWWREDDRFRDDVVAYFQSYGVALYSNFTYFLDDPVNGDQFAQQERRRYGGIAASRSWGVDVAGVPVESKVGVQYRQDEIPYIALLHTAARQTLSTTRADSVSESDVAFFYMAEVHLTEKVRPFFGLREDLYHFNVESFSEPLNSGTVNANVFSPKVGLAVGPWNETEFYGNWGEGFHSNDARGTTITFDPISGLPATPAPALVKSRGGEVGMRCRAIPYLNSTVALWYLDLDSELVFLGDAGTTEASRPSHRQGVEWTNYLDVNSWLTMEADFAWTDARFTDFDPVGDRIPGSLDKVISIGPTIKVGDGWYATAKLRYFGPRPLIEDNSVRSEPTTVVDFAAGRQWGRVRLACEILNLFDSGDHDIDYFYTSRLPGEPVGGVDDIHFHPVEPRTVRANVTWTF